MVETELVTDDVFTFRFPAQPAAGDLQPTGRRPRALEKLLERGMDVPDELFSTPGQARPARRAAKRATPA